MQNRSGNATRHWHGAAATTLTGSLRRFGTGDPAAAALGRSLPFVAVAKSPTGTVDYPSFVVRTVASDRSSPIEGAN
jgi:hypothetical protein